jgi:hypothetical protein
MQDDVIKVARALCALKVSRTSNDWQRYRQEDSWMLFMDEARAAMAATRETDAEALRTAYAPGMRIRPADAADWLQQRANDVEGR